MISNFWFYHFSFVNHDAQTIFLFQILPMLSQVQKQNNVWFRIFDKCLSIFLNI
jgi:hypothetical protein